MFEQQLMRMFYRHASQPEDLPWHQENPPAMLMAAATAGNGPRTALDLGCGAGVFSVALALRGFKVTAVDLMPKALEFTRQRASANGVSIDCVEQDILTWDHRGRYSLVLDSGTLHNLSGPAARRYRNQLRKWIAPDGDFVLGHWGKRHALDWRPIGPRRRSRRTLATFFAPFLVEHAYDASLIRDVPLPLGPTVQGQELWFKRPSNHRAG